MSSNYHPNVHALHQRSQAAEWDTRAAEPVCRWHTRVAHIKDPKQQNGIPEQQNGYVGGTRAIPSSRMGRPKYHVPITQLTIPINILIKYENVHFRNGFTTRVTLTLIYRVYHRLTHHVYI